LVRFKMHSGMSIGSPVLRIKNIDKLLRFYEERLGLHVNRRYQDGEDNDGGGDNLEYELKVLLPKDTNNQELALRPVG
jgi:catechol 2,3-dioxygenase-like lactoylglutathione lyase family enzyme